MICVACTPDRTTGKCVLVGLTLSLALGCERIAADPPVLKVSSQIQQAAAQLRTGSEDGLVIASEFASRGTPTMIVFVPSSGLNLERLPSGSAALVEPLRHASSNWPPRGRGHCYARSCRD